MAARGKLSHKWGHYDPNPPVTKPRTCIRLIDTKEGKRDRDGMADYIEDADWWIARSNRSVRQLQRAFDRGDVAGCLYERTGAIIELGHSGTHYIVAIQLVRIETNPYAVYSKDWDLDMTLSEVGVYVEELWDGETDIDVDDYVVPHTHGYQ